jgi:phosphoglycerate-specific signal transduction histidine kinase
MSNAVMEQKQNKKFEPNKSVVSSKIKSRVTHYEKQIVNQERLEGIIINSVLDRVEEENKCLEVSENKLVLIEKCKPYFDLLQEFHEFTLSMVEDAQKNGGDFGITKLDISEEEIVSGQLPITIKVKGSGQNKIWSEHQRQFFKLKELKDELNEYGHNHCRHEFVIGEDGVENLEFKLNKINKLYEEYKTKFGDQDFEFYINELRDAHSKLKDHKDNIDLYQTTYKEELKKFERHERKINYCLEKIFKKFIKMNDGNNLLKVGQTLIGFLESSYIPVVKITHTKNGVSQVNFTRLDSWFEDEN